MRPKHQYFVEKAKEKIKKCGDHTHDYRHYEGITFGEKVALVELQDRYCTICGIDEKIILEIERRGDSENISGRGVRR